MDLSKRDDASCPIPECFLGTELPTSYYTSLILRWQGLHLIENIVVFLSDIDDLKNK